MSVNSYGVLFRRPFYVWLRIQSDRIKFNMKGEIDHIRY